MKIPSFGIWEELEEIEDRKTEKRLVKIYVKKKFGDCFIFQQILQLNFNKFLFALKNCDFLKRKSF